MLTYMQHYIKHSYNFRAFRPYLSTTLREMFASYALPVAALFISFIGSYLFSKIKRKWSLLKLFYNSFTTSDSRDHVF